VKLESPFKANNQLHNVQDITKSWVHTKNNSKDGE